MEKIDEAMISAVSRRMFAPARLRKILHAMLDRSDQSRASVEAGNNSPPGIGDRRQRSAKAPIRLDRGRRR
jgi:hypothetical protein